MAFYLKIISSVSLHFFFTCLCNRQVGDIENKGFLNRPRSQRIFLTQSYFQSVFSLWCSRVLELEKYYLKELVWICFQNGIGNAECFSFFLFVMNVFLELRKNGVRKVVQCTLWWWYLDDDACSINNFKINFWNDIGQLKSFDYFLHYNTNYILVAGCQAEWVRRIDCDKVLGITGLTSFLIANGHMFPNLSNLQVTRLNEAKWEDWMMKACQWIFSETHISVSLLDTEIFNPLSDFTSSSPRYVWNAWALIQRF